VILEKDLIGAWRLVTHFYLDEDGSVTEGQLGASADGLLIYDMHGFMSVGLMRNDHATDPEPEKPPVTFMGYSGRWRLKDTTVVHEVLVTSHSRILNTQQIREIQLDGGRLVLREYLGGSPRYFVLIWRRAHEE
jgi:hypothetical protein